MIVFERDNLQIKLICFRAAFEVDYTRTWAPMLTILGGSGRIKNVANVSNIKVLYWKK